MFNPTEPVDPLYADSLRVDLCSRPGESQILDDVEVICKADNKATPNYPDIPIPQNIYDTCGEYANLDNVATYLKEAQSVSNDDADFGLRLHMHSRKLQCKLQELQSRNNNVPMDDGVVCISCHRDNPNLKTARKLEEYARVHNVDISDLVSPDYKGEPLCKQHRLKLFGVSGLSDEVVAEQGKTIAGLADRLNAIDITLNVLKLDITAIKEALNL